MIKNNIVISSLVLVAFIVAGYFLISNNLPKDLPENEVNGAQGKIDINVVCEGALAYMSFPDGASADVFVRECKEGKHPQVIEDYKKQMNLGAGAAI